MIVIITSNRLDRATRATSLNSRRCCVACCVIGSNETPTFQTTSMCLGRVSHTVLPHIRHLQPTSLALLSTLSAPRVSALPSSRRQRTPTKTAAQTSKMSASDVMSRARAAWRIPSCLEVSMIAADDSSVVGIASAHRVVYIFESRPSACMSAF